MPNMLSEAKSRIPRPTADQQVEKPKIPDTEEMEVAKRLNAQFTQAAYNALVETGLYGALASHVLDKRLELRRNPLYPDEGAITEAIVEGLQIESLGGNHFGAIFGDLTPASFEHPVWNKIDSYGRTRESINSPRHILNQVRLEVKWVRSNPLPSTLHAGDQFTVEESRFSIEYHNDDTITFMANNGQRVLGPVEWSDEDTLLSVLEEALNNPFSQTHTEVKPEQSYSRPNPPYH